jgi:hypothetical protein
MRRPAIKADDEPNPKSVTAMAMVDRLPKEFRELVYEFGYVEELWFREKLMQLLAMTPEERKAEAEKRKAEIEEEQGMNNPIDEISQSDHVGGAQAAHLSRASYGRSRRRCWREIFSGG